MPELPEVESARKFVEELCSGNKVVRLETKEQGGGPRDGQFDEIVIEGSSKSGLSSDGSAAQSQIAIERELEKVMLNNTLLSVKRKGKNLWFNFSKNADICVLFHFGMTGSFVVRDHPIPTYKSFKVVSEHDWPPKFTKLELQFSNGIQLAFCDPRRLGRIRIRKNCENCPPLSDLAPDPVTEPLPSADEMFQKLQPIAAPIKATLLDQEKLFCGIGNYLADEILYQAGIHPETKSNRINPEGCRRLLEAMQSILRTAIACNADYSLFPKDWLFHYRWGKGKAEQAQLPSGHRVVFETHGGRTSAIVPAKQPKHGYYLLSESAAVSKASKSSPKEHVVLGEAMEQEQPKGRKRKTAKEDAEQPTGSSAKSSVAPSSQSLVEGKLKRAKKAAISPNAPPLPPVPPPSRSTALAGALRRVTRALKK